MKRLNLLTHIPEASGISPHRFFSRLAQHSLMSLFLSVTFVLPAWGQLSGDTEKGSAGTTSVSSSNSKNAGCPPAPPPGSSENSSRLSSLSSRYPLGELAAQLAAYIQNPRFSSEQRWAEFERLPPGLPPLVFTFLSFQAKSDLIQRKFAILLQKHPNASQTLAKVYREYKTILPTLDQELQQGYFPTRAGRAFTG